MTHWSIRVTSDREARLAAIERLTALNGVTAVFDYLSADYLADHREADEMTYTIDDEKLDQVTEIVNRDTDPAATPDLIRSQICADWPEGQEHQDWIDDADPEEIADWIGSFYQGRHV